MEGVQTWLIDDFCVVGVDVLEVLFDKIKVRYLPDSVRSDCGTIQTITMWEKQTYM